MTKGWSHWPWVGGKNFANHSTLALLLITSQCFWAAVTEQRTEVVFFQFWKLEVRQGVGGFGVW